MEVKIIKQSEKVLIWLHRSGKSQKWLAEQLGITRQSVSQKIAENCFSDSEIVRMNGIGFKI